MTINWYPGHMAKSRRLLEDQLSRVDLVIELCDARLPFSSRNPVLDRMINGKNRLLYLNKADLADPAESREWVRFFRAQGLEATTLTARSMKAKEATAAIGKATAEVMARAADRGIRKTVRAMVIGVPNVGKSTFINHLRGAPVSKTGDQPGVTRSNQWVRINDYLEVMDSPGLLWPRLDDQEAAVRLCWLGTVRDDILPLDELTVKLLDQIAELRPDVLQERFHIQDSSVRGPELMLDVCRGRGFLLRGGQPDEDRCCRIVLDEFRAGKLGRITLEHPKK